MTRVSVIVPVYDVAPFLSRCVESALAQTHAEVELLLIDDGSTDGSGALCDAYAASHPQVRVLHKSNGGLSDARNAGLEAATGDFVAFLDGDDWMAAETVAAMLTEALRTGADAVIAGYHVDTHDNQENVVRSDRRTPPPCVVAAADEPPEVSVELMNFVGYAWNKLYRRELLVESGSRFPVGVSLVEDIVFNAPVLSAATRVAFFDEAFVHYVQRPRQTLGTKPHGEFGKLIGMATDATRPLLLGWGITEQRVDELLGEIEFARVQWAVRSVACADSLSLSSRAVEIRALLKDSRVHAALADHLASGRITGPRRWLAESQARGHVWPTLLIHRFRSR